MSNITIKCPDCGSTDTMGNYGKIERANGTVKETTVCSECMTGYVVVYTLDRIEKEGQSDG